MQLNKITYIANAGVLVEINDKKVLIDGLSNSNLKIYKNTPNTIKQQIIAGVPPFHNIDLLLFTHHHSDHFDVNASIEYLRCNEDAVIVSTTKVISAIKKEAPDLKNYNLVVVNPLGYGTETIAIKGISINCISLLHEGRGNDNVENIGYLLHMDGKKILHVGDAKSVKENYMPLNLAKENIDLLLAPFPYVGLPRGRQIVKNYINPKKIAAIHLPYEALDHHGWINTTKKSYRKVESTFVEVIFLEEIGDFINL